LTRNGERNVGGVHHRLMAHRRKIVAVQVNVQDADGHRAPLQSLNLLGEPLRQRHAPPPDADEHQFLQVARALQDLVGQADQGAVDFRSAHQLGFLLSDGHGG
jgi:hypothetical protein